MRDQPAAAGNLRVREAFADGWDGLSLLFARLNPTGD